MLSNTIIRQKQSTTVYIIVKKNFKKKDYNYHRYKHFQKNSRIAHKSISFGLEHCTLIYYIDYGNTKFPFFEFRKDQYFFGLVGILFCISNMYFLQLNFRENKSCRLSSANASRMYIFLSRYMLLVLIFYFSGKVDFIILRWMIRGASLQLLARRFELQTKAYFVKEIVIGKCMPLNPSLQS